MNAYVEVLQRTMSTTRLIMVMGILPSGLLILTILAALTYKTIQKARQEKRKNPYRTTKKKRKPFVYHDFLFYALLLMIPIGLLGWMSSCSVQEAQDICSNIQRDMDEEAYVTYMGEFEIIEHKSRGLFSTPHYSLVLEDDRFLTLPTDICREQFGISGEGTFRGTVVYGMHSEIVVAGFLDPAS